MTWLRNNVDGAIKKHGTLAAVKTPAEAATYKKWLKEKKIWLANWDREVIDSQWKFLEMAKKRGVLTKIPDKEKVALILK